MQIHVLGRWAFIIGIMIAVILGFTSFAYATVTLVILGLIVGLLDIKSKESHNYLVAVITLLLIGFSGLQIFAVADSTIFSWMQNVLTAFVTFVAASGLIVALKEVVKMAED